jgi:lipopolysaccharide biosynthesis glycosyltransferase
MLGNSLSDAILNEQVLSKATVGNNVFHVAFGVDANYFRGMGVTILSLIQNNPNIDFIFHVFYSSITPDDMDKLNQLVEEHPTTIILYQIDQEVFNNLPTFAQFTNAIYNRLLVVNKLKNIADKVLYLDADIVCLTGISEIFDIKMGDNIVAAVQDWGQAAIRQTKKLNINNGYFNSGMLYIDVNKWHDNDVSAKTLKLIIENANIYSFPDQDALNVVLDGKVLFLNQKWNYLFNFDNDIIPSNIILLHYAGRTKPWAEWCLHPVRIHFLQYYRQSPWKDVQFDKPTHYKHMKAYASFTWKNGEYLKSIYWYFKYVQTRFEYKRS